MQLRIGNESNLLALDEMGRGRNPSVRTDAKHPSSASSEVTEVSYLKPCNRNSISLNRLAPRCAQDPLPYATGAVCRLPLRQQ